MSNAEIPNDVVKGGLRLPTSDVAKALFESVLKCQARKFRKDRALFVLRNSIKACPQNIRRYSRMGHSHFGLFVKSDRSCGMKRDGIPNKLASAASRCLAPSETSAPHWRHPPRNDFPPYSGQSSPDHAESWLLPTTRHPEHVQRFLKAIRRTARSASHG